MTPQEKIILGHLKDHTGITSMDAFKLYGITRLSGRIYDMRRQGYNIVTLSRTAKNRFGNTTHFAEYRLLDKK